jgi:O-antigen ligase
VLWGAPLTLLGYALQLTYSRGGLLALLAGIATLFHARYGLRKGGYALLLVLPILLVFGGRQSDISTSKGTGQLRVQLWSEGLVALRSSPIFGIGRDRYLSVAGNHAHNSFVEAYVETGLLGGTMFTAAVYFATMGIYRLRRQNGFPRDPELWAMRPYVLALIVGTFVGQFSSSRAFSLPTYMTLGVAVAYLSLAARQTEAAIERVSPRLLVKVMVIGICGIVTLHLYTKFNAHF